MPLRGRLLSVVSVVAGPAVLALLALSGCGRPARGPQVWLAPNAGSDDMIELFTQPQLWPGARRSTDVFKFYEAALLADAPADCPSCGRNIYPELRRVSAFTRLNAWGLAIGIEVGVLKPWGCAPSASLPRALEAVRRVESERAVVSHLAMDEVLPGAQGCDLTMDEAAIHAALFAREALRGRPFLHVGDIEPYPVFSVRELLDWLAALRGNGFVPAFFHLDVDRAYAARMGADVAGDLRTLRTAVEAQGIPMGVIFWSDQGASDEAYCADVLAWVDAVHAALGEPSHSVFQSWAVSPDGARRVPSNLPEGDARAHTHTRLVNDGLGRLRGTPPGGRP